MSLFNNYGRRRGLRALELGGSAGGASAARARNLALTVAVIMPIVVIYLAIWKFWLTSDFLSSIAASAQSGPLPPSVVSSSAAGLGEVVKPSDQLGSVLMRYFLGIPIYDSLLGSLVPYHAMSFMFIGILGLTTWVRVSYRPSTRMILTRLWTFFGAIWFIVFAMAEFSSAAVDAYISVGFVANVILAGFTACFLLVNAIRKLRGGE